MIQKKKKIIIIIIRLPRKDIRTVIVPMQSGLARLFPASIWVQTDGETTSQIAMRALQWKLRIDGNAFILEKKNKLPKLDLPSVQVAVMAHNLRNARGRLI